jgi:hypothetical protein
MMKIMMTSYCKKIEIFLLQYMKYRPRTKKKRNMATVNPKLATLMRVIEDHQDKMPEGEYLEAMNALAALHRENTGTRCGGGGSWSSSSILQRIRAFVRGCRS